ncbi:MAG: GNAT family N-acetyltransferase [Bacteroidota bacterium]
MMADYTIRPLLDSEHDFLRKMFYESLFLPQGADPFPRTIIDRPDLARYIQNWGSGAHDLALVAQGQTELLGMVWGRSVKQGYGYIDDHTPEIGIAIRESYRGQGLGTALIRAIQQKYFELDVQRLSLSTDKRNPAKRLYERMGFEVVADEEMSCTMLWDRSQSL